MIESHKPDVRLLRQALGRFVTGVTVVATRDHGGRMVGLTVNSFTPLSVDPPLVLWSLNKSSRSLQAFKQAEHFVVNVLAGSQLKVARQMCAPVEDRFAGVIWEAAGSSGLPMISGCAAWFECRTRSKHEGGDHEIFIGEVADMFVDGQEAPLLYFAGNYAVPETE